MLPLTLNFRFRILGKQAPSVAEGDNQKLFNRNNRKAVIYNLQSSIV